MSESSKAVFLSYASQDAEAARRICETLRSAGIEVWFDQSELRGGDAWDAKIRKQIKECALFVPVISANTQRRLEGYYRLEWKLAIDRSHLMSEELPFFVPVVIDETPEPAAKVPDKFRDVQWTRLANGECSSAFSAHIKALLGEEVSSGGTRERFARGNASRTASVTRPKRSWLAPVIIGTVALGVLTFWQTWQRQPPASPASQKTAAPVSEARKLAQQAKALIDDDPLVVRENYLAAERLCQRAIALDPSESEAWAVHARAGVALAAEYSDPALDRKEQARSRAETALRLAPQSVEAGLAFAYYDWGLGGGREAARRVESLWKIAPADRRILDLLARMAFRAGRVEEGARWETEAVKLPGGGAVALGEHGRYHWTRGELPQMEALVDQSLAVQATSAAYHYKLMVLTWGWADLEGARALIAKLPISLRQEDNIALFAYMVELWSRNFDRAVAALERVPREFIEQATVFYPKGYLLGEALHHAGKARAAEIQRRSALKQVETRMASEPNSSRLMLWKGKLLARLGDTAEAARCFEAAEELGISTTRWNHSFKAEKLVLLGRHDEAIAACAELLVRTSSRWPLALNEFRFEPVFDPLRSNPRFQQLIAEGESWLTVLKAQAANSKPQTQNSDPSRPSDAKSIAVLPFANMSPDPENAFFADGVHEDVITNLAKIRDLKVISRTSTLAYRDEKQRNLRKIAEELGVAAVLEGSVRRAGGKVRVSAKLIEARTDQPLWGETYNEDLNDIFAVQAKLAQEIASALKANLTSNERRLIDRRPTENAEAYDLYLRGRATSEQEGSTRSGLEAQVALYEQAIAKDPNFALAHVQLSLANGLLYWFATMDPTPARRARVRAAVDAALRLAPDLPETRMAVGHYAYAVENDWARALAEFRAAEAGMPNDFQVAERIALANRRLGRMQEAVTAFARSVELNPRQVNTHHQQLLTLSTLRRFNDQRTLGMRYAMAFPNNQEIAFRLAIARLELDHDVRGYLDRLETGDGFEFSERTAPAGRYRSAVLRGDFAAAERALADPKLTFVVGTDGAITEPIVFHRALLAYLRGQHTEARELADAAIATMRAEPRTPRQVPAVDLNIALAHALAGRPDDAVALARDAFARQLAYDAFTTSAARPVLARVFLVLGRDDDAWAVLREMMTGPCHQTPAETRLDPFWSRLKSDPRFEEILKSAKPL